MTDPLVYFAFWHRQPPYRATGKHSERAITVLPAQCRTGLVTTSKGGVAHPDAELAVFYDDGKARFGARFMCDGGTENAIALADASAHGNLVCEFCVDAKLGPGVYRCFNTDRLLIYIGSSKTPLKRQRSHATRTPWWHEVADVQVERFPTLFAARGAERLAIVAENPLYNKLPKKRSA